MRRPKLLPILAALALSGGALGACSLPAADKDSDAEARKLFDEIRTGADLREDPNLADFLRAPDKLADLAAIKGELPPGEPTKVENRSWNYNTTNDGSVATLTHAYIYPDNTVMAETVLRKAKGDKTWTIAGFHVSLAHPVAPGQKT